MARRMAKKEFWQEQLDHLYDGHIAPMNNLVDELKLESERGWVPYVAPMYGGVNARLLSVLRDPGPSTQKGLGGGFICMENADPTAEATCEHFSRVKIDARDIVPWNAYPWYINRPPKAAELKAGVVPLKRILDLMPNLQVVMLHGCHAQDGWKRLLRRYPNLIKERNLHVIQTFHTSRQALIHSDSAVREHRKENISSAFDYASQILKAS